MRDRLQNSKLGNYTQEEKSPKSKNVTELYHLSSPIMASGDLVDRKSSSLTVSSEASPLIKLFIHFLMASIDQLTLFQTLLALENGVQRGGRSVSMRRICLNHLNPATCSACS